MDSHQDLPAALADLARDMSGSDGAEGTVASGIAAVLRHVDGAEHAGVTLVTGKKLVTVSPSSDVVRRGDELQYELGEGPCLDAITAEPWVHSADLTVERRWPRWSPRVVRELDVRAMLCLQLFVHDKHVGALNLYASTPHAFTSDDINDASHFATHIAVAVARAQDVEHLQVAVSRRTAIGRAEGVLMSRYGLDPEAAFQVLLRLSQSRNVKLFTIAEQVCADRGLETMEGPRP